VVEQGGRHLSAAGGRGDVELLDLVVDDRDEADDLPAVERDRRDVEPGRDAGQEVGRTAVLVERIGDVADVTVEPTLVPELGQRADVAVVCGSEPDRDGGRDCCRVLHQ
jgi:hypothetical protein